LIQETEREDAVIASRRIPKDVTVQLPDVPVTYEPVTVTADQLAANKPAAAQVVSVSQSDIMRRRRHKPQP